MTANSLRDDHHRDPRFQSPARDERDQRRDDQQLVGDRVHQLAERGHPVARPSEVAVDRIGQRRDREHDRGQEVATAGLVEQRDHQHRHQQDADDREYVWQVQRDHVAPETLARTGSSGHQFAPVAGLTQPVMIEQSMRAIILEQPRSAAEVRTTLPDPDPGPGQLLLHVSACAVCRTDLHLRDGEIDAPKLPVVLGHQIVATTDDGRRVGVPWLGWTDGDCRYCRTGRENLCVNARFTGRDIDGGFAELTVADERFCLTLPEESALSDEQAAPLLCGGLIGYRALTFAGDAKNLGLYGFGSAAHMICQVAVWQGRTVFAFTRTRRRAHPTVRAEPGGRLGRRQRGHSAGAVGRGDHLRPGRRARAAGAQGPRAGRLGDLRRDSHVRHPELPIQRPLAGAEDPLPSRT